jgi:hypothetical protein
LNETSDDVIDLTGSGNTFSKLKVDSIEQSYSENDSENNSENNSDSKRRRLHVISDYESDDGMISINANNRS